MCGAPAIAPAQGATGTITGIVRDPAGLAIPGAVVAIEEKALTARTDARGHFRLAAVPADTLVILVRRLGFEPHRERTTVAVGEERTLEIRLTPLATRLDEVIVRERREVYDARLAGFYSRRDEGKGRFLTREQMDRAPGARLPDLLRRIPGVRVHSVEGLSRVVRLRGARCTPLVFVDGFPASAAEFDLDMLDVSSLEGVEVHSSLATMPPEFGAARGLERCGVIAVWSRPALPRRRPEPVAPTEDLERLVASGAVFTAAAVERMALLDSASTFHPAYPDSLWRAGIGGSALLEFVVAADGGVEPGSVKVVTATHLAFGEAARRAVLQATFRPALLQGRGVRQLVHLPVEFVPGPTSPHPEA